MTRMYLQLGQQSGISKKVLVDFNKSPEEVLKAYDASIELTGVTFDGREDYYGSDSDLITVCIDYDMPSQLPARAYNALVKHGLDLTGIIDDFPAEEGYHEDYGDLSGNGGLVFAELWFRFVRLSLPELKCEFVPDKIEVLNQDFDLAPYTFE